MKDFAWLKGLPFMACTPAWQLERGSAKHIEASGSQGLSI